MFSYAACCMALPPSRAGRRSRHSRRVRTTRTARTGETGPASHPHPVDKHVGRRSPVTSVTTPDPPHPPVGEGLKPVQNTGDHTRRPADELWTTVVIHGRPKLSTVAVTRLCTPRTHGMPRSATVVHSFHRCYYSYVRERDGVFAIADWGFRAAEKALRHVTPRSSPLLHRMSSRTRP